VDAGFLVRKRWEWTGFSPSGRCALTRDQRTPGVSLIFSPCLNDLPEKHTMSELFAGFYRHA